MRHVATGRRLVTIVRPLGGTILCLALMGCSGGQGSDPTGSTEEGLTQTVVHLNPDGTSTVATVPLSVEEQAELADIRLGKIAPRRPGGPLHAITRDTSCASASYWFYTGTSWTGSMLCFDGAGTAVLSSYGWNCGGGSCPQSEWAGSETGEVWVDDVSFGFTVDEKQQIYNVTELQLNN